IGKLTFFEFMLQHNSLVSLKVRCLNSLRHRRDVEGIEGKLLGPWAFVDRFGEEVFGRTRTVPTWNKEITNPTLPRTLEGRCPILDTLPHTFVVNAVEVEFFRLNCHCTHEFFVGFFDVDCVSTKVA